MDENLSSSIIEAILRRRGGLFSPVDLAKETGAAAEEINRTLRQMKTLGYEIDEIDGGLSFILPPPLEVDDSDAAFHIIVHSTVATTMDIAPRLIERGAKTPLTVFADEQIAGRGRGSRKWASPNRLGIYLTIAVDEDIVSIAPTLTGLTTGLALAMTLEKDYSNLRGRIKLKWPNDIYIDGAKTAGILSVKKVDYIYIGCGLNVYQLQNDLPYTEYYDTTSLLLSGIAVLDRGRLARTTADGILRALSSWDDGFIHNLWPIYDYFAGGRITVINGELSISGIAIGIGPLGELLVETGTGIESVVSGDIIEVG